MSELRGGACGPHDPMVREAHLAYTPSRTA